MSGGEREFVFTDDDFQALRQVIHSRIGIALNDSKAEMCYSRLARRLRVLNFSDFRTYLAYVKDNDDELPELANAITTNVTAFFREPHHFEALANTWFPAWCNEKPPSRPVRIWSAGCSTGEEPYTIAMTALESLPPGRSIEIFATDLDTNVLRKGFRGIYEADRIQGVEPKRLKRFFLKGIGSNIGKVRLRPELRTLIKFEQRNLIDDWPHDEPFDAIFCRNVIIYFDMETRRRLIARYRERLSPNGLLFLGHSESLHGVSSEFSTIGRTIYKKN